MIDPSEKLPSGDTDEEKVYLLHYMGGQKDDRTELERDRGGGGGEKK